MRRRDTPAEDASGDPAAATAAGDEIFSSGLLVRKSVRPVGGSFRTGLVLTAILLLLLALVAIWSAIFLPNSAVGRLFGGGTDNVATSSGLPAPDVVSSAPVIGTVEGGGAVAPVQPTLADEAAADGVDLAEDDPTVVVETPVVDSDPVEVAAAAEAALPDIDADLDLPPLPVIDQGQNPTVAEAEALYAEDGIWAARPSGRTFGRLICWTEYIRPRLTLRSARLTPWRCRIRG